MLKALLALNEVTMNISTGTNGQKNVVVMKQGETPLVLRGKEEDYLLMEQEIMDYTSTVSDVVVSSNKSTITKAPKKAQDIAKTVQKGKTAKPTKTAEETSKSPVKEANATPSTATGNIEDEHQLNLIGEDAQILPSFDDILSEFKI